MVVALLLTLAGCGSGDDGSPAVDPGGPMTVEQLQARSADAPVEVKGLLYFDGSEARLCEAILESYPPQCGEPSVQLAEFGRLDVEGTTTAEGVTWKEGAEVTVVRVADGRFVIVDAGRKDRVEVVLGLYSGVPDPAWALTAAQADVLTEALDALEKVDEPPESGGLGYHGFTVNRPEGTLVAYAGRVVSAESEPRYVLDDPDRTIERLLLSTAGDEITADERRTVANALDDD